ncbi:MAG: M23 family metallopeptidase [Ignavibacteriota bacterium]|nr:M23 family metallopeptidase [Ignavibacteriota bacterium]MCO6447944.1 M23 family metallopeptidase [Ignavibacterium album]MCZ2267691.1 M23 family metallopeptidase [Ignavibacteriales bacterium]QKJ99089.1 MAG: M23 family metallopeptidase [Ignavibacteriota bacterium]HOJ07042.1 M23 family metallopeptidase [Ignavibacteriaceae bacterium]
MKKFYYFSEKSLNFLEIKHFKKKLVTYFTVSVIFFSALIFGTFYLVSGLLNNENDISILKDENKKLKGNILKLSKKYSDLEKELSSITEISDELRLATNLTPINPEERTFGIGGSSSLENFYDDFSGEVSDALTNIDKVSQRFEFEKAQYNEIVSKLNQNRAFYESIPAILPTNGKYSSDSYGMRVHPVLGVNKMHNGIDIITDVGTNVKSSGKGKVIFSGSKPGYGLAVEIDHGFGYRTIYAHLSKIMVHEGQSVKRGEIIAKSGNTGLSTGPHLHYEVLHNGENLNPVEFFFDEYNYFESN